jgi:hypothetical protein
MAAGLPPDTYAPCAKVVGGGGGAAVVAGAERLLAAEDVGGVALLVSGGSVEVVVGEASAELSAGAGAPGDQ